MKSNKEYDELFADFQDERHKRLIAEERELEAVNKLKEGWVASNYVKLCDVKVCPECGGSGRVAIVVNARNGTADCNGCDGQGVVHEQ